jgi:hypothetical protein
MAAEPPEPEYPWFEKVPLDPDKNQRWRKKINRECSNSTVARERMHAMCAEDSLLWLSSFCVLFEPRPTPRTFSFIPWTHQIPVWKEMEKWLGYRDVGLEKSRAEGASWMILMLCLHKWIYMPMFAAGFVSKDEKSVDDPKNPDSLFWKIQFQLDNLPEWMVPRYHRVINTHTFTNLDIGGTLAGYAATGDVASGGRKTLFVLDELAKFPRGPDKEAMASTQYVTECRYLISTPKGPDGAYFEAMHGTSNMLKLHLSWEDNPSRTVGAYKVHIASDNTRSLEIVDAAFWIKEAERNGSNFKSTGEMMRAADAIRADDNGKNPFGYPFMMTGQYVKSGCLRSPWYDYQCNRPGATPQNIAQELDRDYGGSSSRFFDNNMLQRVKIRCSTPVTVGELGLPKAIDSHHELMTCRFREIYGARLKLWFKPSIYGTVPPGRRYVIGGDIASGTGGAETHNSCLEVIDVLVGRQVAEIAGNTITPFELAEYAVALAYWFSYDGVPAKLIWEQNGLGGQFALRITQLGFSNIYYRSAGEEYQEKETKKIGFWTTAKTKPALLGELGRAIDSGQLEVNSYSVIEEMAYYTNFPGGKIEHIAAINEEDPSGSGDRHGDRVVALALAWWEAKEYVQDVGNANALQSIVPANSVLGRRQQARGEQQKRELWVPSSLRRRSSTRSN